MPIHSVPLGHVERAVLFFNPAYEHLVGDAERQLVSRDIPVEVHETSPDLEGNKQIVHGLGLQKGDVLFSLGGDGTNRILVHSLLDTYSALDKPIPAPLCPYRGGNSGDIVRGAHGRSAPNIATILKSGRIIPAHAINIHVTQPEGTSSEDLALSYASLGWSAEGAGLLADNKRRGIHPNVGNFKVVMAAFFSGTSFKAQNAENEFEAGDYVIANGGSMAKGLMKFPDKYHWDRKIRVVQTAPTATARLGNIAAMAFNVQIGKNSTSETLILHSLTHMQVDGEPPVSLPGGTTIEFSLSPTFPLVVTHQSVLSALRSTISRKQPS